MQAVLIPFLLVANISLNNEVSWSDGALAKYKIFLEEIVTNSSEMMFHLNGTFDISCTTKSTVRLLCRTSDLDVNFNDTNSLRSETIRKSFSFEVKFNENGVEHIAVPKDTRFERIAFLRKLVSLFDIGTNFKERKYQLPSFETSAKGLMGICKTKYTLSELIVDRSSPIDKSISEKSYEVFITSLPQREADRVTVIDKEIDAITCDKYGLYFFDQLTNVLAETTLYKIRISIGERGFFEIRSHAEGRYSSRDESIKDEFGIKFTLHIQLEDIEAVREPLPEVQDPKIVKFSLSRDDKKDVFANQ